MYIEDKLFSENNPEEVLFSVTMSEIEYDLYSEFQKEFASVRLMKKQGKRLIDAAMQGNSKAAGRISSTMIRNGGTKHVRDHALSSGFEKVSNGVTGHAAKLDGVTATPELKKELFRENVKNNLKLSRQFRKTGGKLGPGGNPIM